MKINKGTAQNYCLSKGTVQLFFHREAAY